MNKLSERSKILILEGARVTGTFTEGFSYSYEQFYVDEADEMSEFCKWVDENIGGGGRNNIETLFLAFKNPTNKEYQQFVKELKQKIDEIKQYMN